MTIVRLGDLRKAISAVLREDFYTRNATSPATADREQLRQMTMRDIDSDEMADHLHDQTAEIEDCQGPVPVKGENQPYVTTDPYTRWAGSK
jgi:hypothetical protein